MSAVIIKNLGKYFKVPPSGWIGPIKKIKFLLKPSENGIWAIKELNLSVKKGECLGIIGRNGSGKTTLLKLITGVLNPTEGRIEKDGTIFLMHDLGSGFDFELTGKENLFLHGAIAGMSDKEINKKLESVKKFSELGRFMNLKLKTYSSGMVIRLAFSATTITNPDIMLIDEIINVGDIAFQSRSLNKIKEYKQSGKTILIVSQNMQPLIPLCDRYLLLDKGKKVYCGCPEEAFKRYTKILYNNCEKGKGLGIISEFLITSIDLMNYINDKSKKENLARDLKRALLRSVHMLNSETDITVLNQFVNTFHRLHEKGHLKSAKDYEALKKVINILRDASPTKEHNKELSNIKRIIARFKHNSPL